MQMKTLRLALAAFIFLATVLTVTHVAASDDRGGDSGNRLRATLIGFEEVPVVSTVAKGRLKAEIATDGQSIDYELTFSGLQGVVQQSHIHVAQKSVNGVIVLWLCQGATRAPAAAGFVPECPQQGTVTGTLTAANVVQPAPPAQPTQQILAGELDEVIAAIRAGNGYANVHTAPSPGGEIRGQIRVLDDDHKGK
jgi:CHRD domain-containing protein